MNIDFTTHSSMQYQLKALKGRVAKFESGEIYAEMKKGQDRQRRYYEGQLRRQEKEAANLRKALEREREKWFEVFQDVQDECARRVAEMELALEKALKERADMKSKIRKNTDELIETRAKVQDEQEKSRKLQAQIDQDFHNSSLPSSSVPFRGKVANNREKSGRKQGAQPGHEGHGRKQFSLPTESIHIPTPPEIAGNPDYYRQEGERGTIHKQVIGIRMDVIVRDYQCDVYRSRATGARAHAAFPENVTLEVNYDESVRAVIFLLRNHFNMPIEKVREFLSKMTGGVFVPSHGMVSDINREFSAKTEGERQEIFAKLLTAETMYSDMTSARWNGKRKNVVICTDKENTLYFFRDTKGDAALKGTPVENFTNTIVHDHDKTFYHYGSNHQECVEHILRYLKGAGEVETGLTWHKQMRGLLQEMNTVREANGRKLPDAQVEAWEAGYDSLLALAEREYYDNPPTKYYRKGYNLYRQLRDYKGYVLAFLRDPSIDFTNNESERKARKVKRHMVVSCTFRGHSNRSGEEYCDAMGMLETARAKGDDIYEMSKEVFARPNPRKKQGRDAKGRFIACADEGVAGASQAVPANR